MRDWILAALLASAGVLIVVGVAEWSAGFAWITGGVLLAGWSLLVFVVGDAFRRSPPAGDVT